MISQIARFKIKENSQSTSEFSEAEIATGEQGALATKHSRKFWKTEIDR